jgi:pimeloyl-ACP methyl ester carboxylesterase
MRFKLSLAALLAAGPTLHAAPAAKQPPMLHEQRYGEDRASRVRTLAVVLHADGDTSIAPAYSFTEATAKALTGSTSIALLRPGYADTTGRRSPGERGRANGDGYTRERVGEVARSLIALRKRYRRAKLILIGEGGGAAIAANLVGIYPTLADGLLLVSCPCALPEWRRTMAKRSPNAGFDQPVTSLDPLQTIGGVSPALRAAVLVGADDPAGLARYSRTYAEALALRGIAVDFRILPARPSSAVLSEPEVADALKRLATSLPEKRK